MQSLERRDGQPQPYPFPIPKWAVRASVDQILLAHGPFGHRTIMNEVTDLKLNNPLVYGYITLAARLRERDRGMVDENFFVYSVFVRSALTYLSAVHRHLGLQNGRYLPQISKNAVKNFLITSPGPDEIVPERVADYVIEVMQQDLNQFDHTKFVRGLLQAYNNTSPPQEDLSLRIRQRATNFLVREEGFAAEWSRIDQAGMNDKRRKLLVMGIIDMDGLLQAHYTDEPIRKLINDARTTEKKSIYVCPTRRNPESMSSRIRRILN